MMIMKYRTDWSFLIRNFCGGRQAKTREARAKDADMEA
jgi:hypothetical protein